MMFAVFLFFAQFVHFGSAGWGIFSDYTNNVCQGNPVFATGIITDVCMEGHVYTCENGNHAFFFFLVSCPN
jgi:hypothetical protein